MADTTSKSNTVAVPGEDRTVHIGHAQWAILADLDRNGTALTIDELAHRVGVEGIHLRYVRDNLVKRIRRLEDYGLVGRDYPLPDGAKRGMQRSTVYLTESGQALLYCASCNKRAKYLDAERFPACHTHAARLTMFEGVG